MILASHGIIGSQISVAPVAIAATGVGATSFTANWEAYSGAVVYLLDVSASPTFNTFIYEDEQVNAPTTSYVVIGLTENTTYYYRVRASTESLTDPDAAAFFARVADATGTLSATEKTAVNTLVVQMKFDGIWDKMKAIYPMVGASDAACKQNLKSSSFTGVFTSGWIFASTGATPNGSSAYMNTGLNASTQLTSPSHLSYYTGTNGNTNTDQIDIGVRDFWLSLWYKSSGLDNLLARNQSATVLLDGGVVTDSRGFGITSKIGTTAKIFMNNVIKTSATDITTLYTNNTVAIGAYNASGFALFSNRDCRFASIGDGLTDTEASNFYNAVQAFQETLNRDV